MSRITRQEMYMSIAGLLAKRSTCNRKSVGAVLVRDNHILGTGYNGAPKAQQDCIELGCLLEHGHCVRTVHAEVNAVLSAAYNGVSTKDSTLYSTAQPCFRCMAFLINAGVKAVYFGEEYIDKFNLDIPPEIKIEKFNEKP